ncbi:MAG: glycosyltransferase [Pirellulales bacterium]
MSASFAAAEQGLPPIFVVGYPSALGGADTELWHVLKLWRSHGLEVTLIPTWRTPPEWRRRCDTLGLRTCEIEGPAELASVPGLADAIVVSFCNDEFLRRAGDLRALGCRLVWANCMTWIFTEEERHYEQYGPFDAHVFQSRFQRENLLPTLTRYGVSPAQCHLIHGALDLADFAFRPLPHAAGEEFIVGRISRADPSKFHPDTWELFAAVPYRPFKVRVLGWSDQVQEKLGPPPSWAEALPPGGEPADQFLRSVHCLAQVNGGAQENWPRVGLEALASGTPLVVQHAWGWREMLVPEQHGLLAAEPADVPALIGRLAQNNALRGRLASAGRDRVIELTNPAELWAQWRRLFVGLRDGRRPAD